MAEKTRIEILKATKSKLVEAKGKQTYDQIINGLLDGNSKNEQIKKGTFEIANLGITDPEVIEKINKILKKNNISFQDFVKQSVIKQANITNGRNSMLIKSVAEQKISLAIEKIKSYNEKTDSKLCLTKGVVKK